MSAVHNAAKSHLHHIAEYLRHWDMPVHVLWSGKAYASVTNMSGSLGGIVFEGRTPFSCCEDLSDLVSRGVLDAYMKPPEGMYFECDASWCISLHLSK